MVTEEWVKVPSPLLAARLISTGAAVTEMTAVPARAAIWPAAGIVETAVVPATVSPPRVRCTPGETGGVALAAFVTTV